MRTLVFLLTLSMCSTVNAIASAPCITNDIAIGLLRGSTVNSVKTNSWETLTIGRNFIVYPYAIQVWSTAHRKGQALLKMIDYSKDTWVTLANRKGPWTVLSLIQAGVPRNYAEDLVAAVRINHLYRICDQ